MSVELKYKHQQRTRYNCYNTYDEIIRWLEEHDGEMPRGIIHINRKNKTVKEMTEDENYEVNLYARWRRCEEKKILDEYTGRAIEEVPKEYMERVRALREYGLGLEKKKEIKTYEEIIEWLEEHNGEMPRPASLMKKDGRYLKVDEMTVEQNYEVNLYSRWIWTPEKIVLDEYAGRPIEEVPEEYREKIAKLRSLGQMGKRKDDKIKTRMKESVAKEVGNNEEVRRELEKTEIELQSTADFKGE